jgi:hypothetical protein
MTTLVFVDLRVLVRWLSALAFKKTALGVFDVVQFSGADPFK